MFSVIRASNSGANFSFFVVWLVVGKYTLLSLFLAVIMEAFEVASDREEAQRRLEQNPPPASPSPPGACALSLSISVLWLGCASQTHGCWVRRHPGRGKLNLGGCQEFAPRDGQKLEPTISAFTQAISTSAAAWTSRTHAFDTPTPHGPVC